MNLAEDLKQWLKNLKINFNQTILLGIVVFIFGILLLSFTYILPVLALITAFAIIIAFVFVIYKILGGN